MSYPKTMVHPLHLKGITIAVPGEDRVTGRKFTDYQGTPDRFPPVIVNHPAQELQHRSQGYIAEGEVAPGHSYARYPMWLTKAESPDVLVSSEVEEAARMKEGYKAPGKADPIAAEALAASPHVPGRTVVEFPKMVDGKLVPADSAGGFQEYPKWHEGELFNSRADLERKYPPRQIKDDKKSGRNAA